MKPMLARLSLTAALLLLPPAAWAQRTGPMPPPEGIRKEEPPIPAQEIIRRFAEKEAEFKLARDNYSYRQSVLVRDYTEAGRPAGEFRRDSEVIFLDSGDRFEKVTYEPPSTLSRFVISREDLQDIENIQPFVLTTEDLPQYAVDYLGKEEIDELDTYVFSVRPRQIVEGLRYFQGTIWVDDVDLQIVKTRGKAVPDIREKKQENLFPVFETYRENIDGQYWFPTYTRADDTLAFSQGAQRITILVRYTGYKKRAVTSRIVGAEKIDPPPLQP